MTTFMHQSLVASIANSGGLAVPAGPVGIGIVEPGMRVLQHLMQTIQFVDVTDIADLLADAPLTNYTVFVTHACRIGFSRLHHCSTMRLCVHLCFLF